MSPFVERCLASGRAARPKADACLANRVKADEHLTFTMTATLHDSAACTERSHYVCRQAQAPKATSSVVRCTEHNLPTIFTAGTCLHSIGRNGE